jgi:hypothetical protein
MAWTIPSTPFKGVQISWLMVARNSPLARFAVSAASSASCCAFAGVALILEGVALAEGKRPVGAVS